MMPDEDAEQVFAQLHKNMFRAFDYRNESDVYDALAKSVDGELLRRAVPGYQPKPESQRTGRGDSRSQRSQFARGKKSDIVDRYRDLTPGFGYRCKWNLIGTIEHWGHIHERENQYDAEFEIQLAGRRLENYLDGSRG